MSYTRTNLLRFILLVTFGSVLAACGDTGTAEPRLRNLVYCENPEVAEPSCTLPGYTVADDSVLHDKLQSCAAGGCHGDSATGQAVTTWKLDLSGSVESALGPLANTIGLSGDYLVDELDPDCSYMLTKVTAQPAGGSRMPLTPPLWSDAETDCFRSYLHDMSN